MSEHISWKKPTHICSLTQTFLGRVNQAYTSQPSLRSKRFRLVSEHRKTDERDSRFWPREKWNESKKMKEGGGGGERRKKKAKQFIGQLSQLMRVPNVGEQTQAWQTQVGGFQNLEVFIPAFPSFLPHPLPAVLLTPFFARSLTLVPRSLLLNCTETLAT